MKSIKESMKAIANAYYEEEISEEEEIRADERAKTISEIEIKLCAEIHFGYELEARVCDVLEQIRKGV